MPFPTNIHAYGNAIEAIVWCVLGSCVFTAGYLRPHVRSQCVTVAIVLIAFGISDIVEISTGAWWHPWWLLAWKGACMLILCWQWYLYGKRNFSAKERTE